MTVPAPRNAAAPVLVGWPKATPLPPGPERARLEADLADALARLPEGYT